MKMKYIVFVFCKEAFWGAFSPLSFLTEINLQKAFDCLKAGNCDFLYIAIDHFDDEKKKKAEEYLNNYVKSLQLKQQTRIIVSPSSKPCMEMFAEYVKNIPGEICVDIFARVNEKSHIENSLNIALDRQLNIRRGNMPLVFVGNRREV